METSAAQQVLAKNPYLQLLGIELDRLADGEAICRLRAEEKHTRIGDFLHGGATASLIDTAMAFAVGSVLGTAAHAVTVNLTIHYLRPISAGEIIAKSTVRQAGKRLLTVAAEVFDASGELAATALATYSKINPKPFL